MINTQRWLDENGEPVPALRRQVLRLARLIEYAGPLEIGQTRGTLVECSRRVDRRACQAILWVSKIDAETIEACCLKCLREHVMISGWMLTEWALLARRLAQRGSTEPVEIAHRAGGPREATRSRRS